MVVTPFVGVWIEIISAIPASMSCGVTPFVGVWIEIGIPHDIAVLIMSLPSWECGLKSPVGGKGTRNYVTPFVGVWIEIDCGCGRAG